MKSILSLLMCFVLLQAQTFALRGGPQNSGGEKVLGAYSGVLTETSGGTDMGLFLLATVQNGASYGQVVFFSASTTTGNVFGVQNESDTYIGIITGITDASRGGSGSFYGIFNGSASTGSGANRSINGQMTVSAYKVGNNTQRLTGTASSQTVSVDSVGGNAATGSGQRKSYSVAGWLTSQSEVGGGFAL